MKNFIFKILLGLLLSLNFAFADIREAFQDYYYSSEISSRHCGRNIEGFIRYLSQKGFYRSDIKVLSITAPNHPWSFGNVVAVNSRWGRLNEGSYHENWAFHVVAVIDGSVYDFSYNQLPKITAFNSYLQDMFIPKQSFMINGSSFRVRGKGPYYTPADAQVELSDYKFKVYSTDSRGALTEIQRNLSPQQVKNLL